MKTRFHFALLVLFFMASNAQALDSRLKRAGVPPNTELGNFRILCDFSHAAADDPIVKWGQPGESHLHFFFGNTKTDAFSTTESLLTAGGSTCQGQGLNRSAYWIPAVFNADEQVRIPDDINIYYKNQSDEPASSIAEIPEGLRMIAGNAMGNSPDSTNNVFWRCVSWPYNANFPSSSALPVCDPGDGLLMNVSFPNCWNGIDLTSEDQSHMAYSEYVYDSASGNSVSLCPATHATHLPRITYLFTWQHQNESTDGWFIASDRHHNHQAEPGTTLHADWWNGWRNSIVAIWTQECLRESRDCDTGNLGNGTAMVREFKAGAGRVAKLDNAAAGHYCNGRRATIVGTNGDDELVGTEAQDVIVGLGGDDIINALGDKDIICAGSGNDFVDGGAGDDEIRAGAGDDTIYGGDGRDRIYAGGGDDFVAAGKDADSVYGQSGIDTINTDEGHDWAFGGRGDDVIVGSYFTDRLYGQNGNDQLNGVGGQNVLIGGSGLDVCDSGGETAILIRSCP